MSSVDTELPGDIDHGQLDHETDFVFQFMELTEGSFSPEIFRKWTAIGLVAGALERRVWIRTGSRTTFPSLYTMLVAPPGVGKQVLDDGRDLMNAVPGIGTLPAFRLSPDSMTKAALMDELLSAKQIWLPPKGEALSYHSLFIIAEEAGLLLPAYDMDFISVMNRVYNCPSMPLRETRRHGPAKDVTIPFPQLNILIGAQPGWLASVFPEEAWSTGLTSRMMMIYCADTPLRDIFEGVPDREDLRLGAIRDLRMMSRLYGEFEWTAEAVERLRSWHMAGGPPVPTHSKLEHYIRRRTQHLAKLVMVSAVSRTAKLGIELIDVERGLAWLIEAEGLMPDIFRAMMGKSDTQVLEELYLYTMGLWRVSGQKPVHESQLWNFLRQRVPGEKIERLIQVAERANMVVRQAGTPMFVPKAKHQHGME